MSMLSKPFTILNTSIKSPLSLRDSSVVKPNILSLSRWHIFKIR